MERVARFDTGKLGKAVITNQGYLRVPAMVARTGILIYKKGDGTVTRELVLSEVLLNEDSLKTLALIPMCNDHPPVKLLDVDTTRMYQVGYTGETIEQQKEDDEIYIGPMATITDRKAIEDVDAGKQELSAGYTCRLDETPGIYKGQKYDAVQRERIYNHIAIVSKGRAGENVRLHLDGSDATENNNVEAIMKTVKIDGVSFEVEEKLAEKIDGLMKVVADAKEEKKGDDKKIQDCKDKIAALKDELAEAEGDDKEGIKEELKKAKDSLSQMTAEKDKASAKSDALEAALKKVNEDAANPVKVQEAVKARILIIGTAQKAITDRTVLEKIDGMSDVEIKKAVILAVTPDAKAKLDSGSEAYIDARFDTIGEMITKENGAESLGKLLNQSRQDAAPKASEVETSRAEQLKRSREAYLPKA